MASKQLSRPSKFGPPTLVMANLGLLEDIEPPWEIGMGVWVNGLSGLKDDSFFESIAKETKDLGKGCELAVFYCPDLEPKLGAERLTQFLRLLSLHGRTAHFDPGRLCPLMLRLPTTNDSSSFVLLNGSPVPMTDIRSAIRGHAITNPLQTVHISNWLCVAHDPDGPGSSFAFTLKYLWPVIQEDASFWRSLGMLRQGLVNLTGETAGIAVVLIAAAFEALVPISGKENITKQLSHMLSVLTGEPKINKWFKDLYGFRSTIIHGDDPLEEKDRKTRHKYEHILATAARHAETAKTVIQIFALQRRLLCTDIPATETSDLIKARNHVSAEAARLLSHNNEWGCTQIKQCEKDGTKTPLDEISNFLFDPEDSSAPVEMLIRRGFDLAEAIARQLTDRSVYNNRVGNVPLSESLSDRRQDDRKKPSSEDLEQKVRDLEARLVVAMNSFLLADPGPIDWEARERVYDLGDSLLKTVRRQLAVREEDNHAQDV